MCLTLPRQIPEEAAPMGARSSGLASEQQRTLQKGPSSQETDPEKPHGQQPELGFPGKHVSKCPDTVPLKIFHPSISEIEQQYMGAGDLALTRWHRVDFFICI